MAATAKRSCYPRGDRISTHSVALYSIRLFLQALSETCADHSPAVPRGPASDERQRLREGPAACVGTGYLHTVWPYTVFVYFCRPSPKLVLIILQLCRVALPLMNGSDCEKVLLPAWGQDIYTQCGPIQYSFIFAGPLRNLC